MPELRKYQIFISHSWKYSQHYQAVENLLTKAPNLKFSNSSVPQSDGLDPEDTKNNTVLKAALKRQVAQAQVVLVLGGMYADFSKWIKFEIEQAVDMNKPIILITPLGQEKVPGYLQTAADKIVGWQTSSIVEAIRELA